MNHIAEQMNSEARAIYDSKLQVPRRRNSEPITCLSKDRICFCIFLHLMRSVASLPANPLVRCATRDPVVNRKSTVAQQLRRSSKILHSFHPRQSIHRALITHRGPKSEKERDRFGRIALKRNRVSRPCCSMLAIVISNTFRIHSRNGQCRSNANQRSRPDFFSLQFLLQHSSLLGRLRWQLGIQV